MNLRLTVRRGEPVRLSGACAVPGGVTIVMATGDMPEEARNRAVTAEELRQRLTKTGGTAKLLLILAVSFLLCGPLQALRPKLKEALYARKAPSLAGAAGLLVLLFFGLMRVTAGTYSAFIYFQF